MTFEDVRRLSPLYLNLGGKNDCHPKERYEHYVSVDDFSEGSRSADARCWIVDHDLRAGIPLPDHCADRIHTEHFLHYLTEGEIERLLPECFRVLKRGGFMRIAVPDYGNPKDRRCIAPGKDPRHPRHLTITTEPLMRRILGRSPFTICRFLHYWDGDRFIGKPVDYGMGFVRRTPDNDPRCGKKSHGVRWQIRNFLFRLSRGFRVKAEERPFLRGDRLHITSIIVDCFKE